MLPKQSKPQEGRIVAIDVLRGFALLGILLMNIRLFVLPDIVYESPSDYGNEAGYNRMSYYLTAMLAQNKFMALFSMLFGASVLLFTDNLRAKGKGVWPYFVRNWWLLMIGAVHMIFIWSGDILFVYALCAFPLYFFRKLAARKQLILGIGIFFFQFFFSWAIQGSIPYLGEESQESHYDYWHSEDEDIQEDLDLYLGSYPEQMAHRWEGETNLGSNAGELLRSASLWGDYIGRALGMMLIGMALYRWGGFSAELSERTYCRMMVWGFGIGIPLSLIGLEYNLYNIWDWQTTYFYGRIPHMLATGPIACGYIGLVMLWCKGSRLPWLRNRLAEVGRTALSCYIGQSLIATFIFYGFGLGLYGSVDYFLQLVIVVGIWVLQIFLVRFWLKYFRQGPLEWLWRCLTYFRLQPFRRARGESDAQRSPR